MSLCLGTHRDVHRFAWEGALPEIGGRFGRFGSQCLLSHPEGPFLTLRPSRGYFGWVRSTGYSWECIQ